METDAFFYQLFQQLPQTLFELLDLPAALAKSYRFDSVELKKAFRIDGLFLPNKPTLPVYFAEIQFQRRATFYANLFAKVFSYLHENDPKQEWVAVAIFRSRKEEPKHLGPYEDLLKSKRVKRIYLDKHVVTKKPPLGLGVVKLLFASETQAQKLVPRIVQKAESELADSGLQAKVVELVERLLLLRFPELDLEEIRMKFKLHDIRESKVWKQAVEEGDTLRLKKTIYTLMAKRKTLEEIAELLDIPVDAIRRLANGQPDGRNGS